MMTLDRLNSGFFQLALAEPVQKALVEAGYETPTPIQALTIPHLLNGCDVVGQAQTGTGKTAAFALPLLSRIDMGRRTVQVLVLTPTRELAIQVAAGFEKYACHIRGFRVLALCGGQEFDGQLRALKSGVHVVVGTPGRIMDHMRRGTLSLDTLASIVLDEADEMLKMGFIDDVEWILSHAPQDRQTLLFSATMPPAIRKIAARHLKNPQEVIIESRTTAAVSIRQRYLVVHGSGKAEALARILENEDHNGVLVFVKTRVATVDVSEKLLARGYPVCALNGDMSQSLRERAVQRLKSGHLDIIVATDVAARGLDVERISHVINFDSPNDAETYVHRIGRTGRAGRSGESILFLNPAERRVLQNIERATRQPIEPMEVPSIRTINENRIRRFNDRITETMQTKDISFFRKLVDDYCAKNDAVREDVAAAVAHILQGDVPMLLQKPAADQKPVSKKKKANDQRPPHKKSKRQGHRRRPAA